MEELSTQELSMLALLTFEKDNPSDVPLLESAIEANLDFDVLRLANALSQWPFIRGNAEELVYGVRQRVTLTITDTELSPESSHVLLMQYARENERLLQERIEPQSRLFWFRLIPRFLPLIRKSNDAVTSLFVNRVIDLAVSKYGKQTLDDVWFTGGLPWITFLTVQHVQRLMEIYYLSADLYDVTVRMRLTAKMGRLQLPDWSVAIDDETAKMVEVFDHRSTLRSTAFTRAGIHVEESVEGPAGGWATMVADENVDHVVWPLRMAIRTRDWVTDDDNPTDEYYIPRYLIQAKDAQSAFEALEPYADAIRCKLGFRIEDLFAVLHAMFGEAQLTEWHQPGIYRELQTTGYDVVTPDFIAQLLRSFLPGIYEAFLISYLQEMLRFLAASPEGASPRAVFDSVRKNLGVDGLELTPYSSQPGVPRFETIVRFMTLAPMKAQWMIKQDGLWYITDAGRTALSQYRTAEELRAAASKAYKAWKKSNTEAIEAEDADGFEAESERLPSLSVFTLEDARERARESILGQVKKLDPFEFQDMVAALLKGMGYYISSKAAPGKDRGIDIVAYKDPLGAQLPRLKVQVKHTDSPTGRPEIQKFFGAIGHDDIGIFVSSGGFSSDAKEEVRSHATAKVTLVDFSDMLSLWIKFYDGIDEQEKRFLRLEPVYFPTE